ncbi:MAG: hypothetical protein ACU85E_13210 [Gammaproteobacteria bacterium]
MKAMPKKLQTSSVVTKKQPITDLPFEDDRYPGSFFKVPGTPQPGKTSWRKS